MTEMDKLEQYLKDHGVKYKRIDKPGPALGFGGQHQILAYDSNGNFMWDAICHWGSYGWREGLLEIMGSIVNKEKAGDCVEGYLTANDVIERINRRRDLWLTNITSQKGKLLGLDVKKIVLIANIQIV